MHVSVKTGDIHLEEYGEHQNESGLYERPELHRLLPNVELQQVSLVAQIESDDQGLELPVQLVPRIQTVFVLHEHQGRGAFENTRVDLDSAVPALVDEVLHELGAEDVVELELFDVVEAIVAEEVDLFEYGQHVFVVFVHFDEFNQDLHDLVLDRLNMGVGNIEVLLKVIQEFVDLEARRHGIQIVPENALLGILFVQLLVDELNELACLTVAHEGHDQRKEVEA